MKGQTLKLTLKDDVDSYMSAYNTRKTARETLNKMFRTVLRGIVISTFVIFGLYIIGKLFVYIGSLWVPLFFEDDGRKDNVSYFLLTFLLFLILILITTVCGSICREFYRGFISSGKRSNIKIQFY